LHTLASCLGARRRVVTLLTRSCVCLQKRLEPLEVRFRSSQLDACNFGLVTRRLRLRDRLGDLFLTRSRLHQAQLRLGLLTFGFGAFDGELHVARIDARDDRAGGELIALPGEKLDESAANLGRKADFGGFDVPGGADFVGRRLWRTPPGGNTEQDDHSAVCHDGFSSMRNATCCM
jgi:hypothetical protein